MLLDQIALAKVLPMLLPVSCCRVVGRVLLKQAAVIIDVEAGFVVVASVTPVLQEYVVPRRCPGWVIGRRRHRRRGRANARCLDRRRRRQVVVIRRCAAAVPRVKTLVVVTPPSAAADLLHNLVFGAWHQVG